MRVRHIASSAVIAGLITAVPVSAWLSGTRGVVSPNSWVPMFYRIVELPIWPGVFLAGLIGIRGGPDGMPSINAMIVAAFVFWWAFIGVVSWVVLALSPKP